MNARDIEQKVDMTYIQNVLMELIKIESINPPKDGGEKKAAEFLAGKLQELAIDAEVHEVADGRANAVGIISGSNTGPTLVLNGHLDVVGANPEYWDNPPFDPVIRNRRIYGRGAADMKGAIASMIGAVKLIKEADISLKGRVLLSFVCDEESKNLGTLDFLQRYPDVDYAIIGEPTSLNLVTAHRGVARFRIGVGGKAGHAGEPENAVNAVCLMNRIISALQDYQQIISKRKHRMLPSPTCSITTIRGGQTDNVIPDTCEITIDRRLIPGEDIEQVESELKEIIQGKAGIEEDGYTMERYIFVGPGELEPNRPFFSTIEAIYGDYFDVQNVETQGFRATCEQSLFIDKGIDTAVFGPGSIGQAHQANEYVEIDELRKAAGFYYYSVLSLLGRKGN